MTSPAKIGAFALVGSCVTAGCAGGIYLTSGTPIKDLMNEEYQYILLDTSTDTNNKDKTKWGEVWGSYKKDSKNVFNLEGWKSDNSDFDLTEALKKKCSELSDLKISSKESALYKNVTKYCARGVTFEEQAKKEGLNVLNTSETDRSTVWVKRHENKSQITADLKNLEINGDTTDGSAIKTGCNTAKAKNKQITNYETVYKSFKKVCTKQDGDPNS